LFVGESCSHGDILDCAGGDPRGSLRS